MLFRKSHVGVFPLSNESDEEYEEDSEGEDGGFDLDDEDDDDLALLFENASVAEVDTYEELVAALNNVRTGGTLYLADTSEEGTGLITGGFANSGGGIFNVGSIQILGSNSICDNESD